MKIKIADTGDDFKRWPQPVLRFFVAVAVAASAQFVSAQGLKISDFDEVVKPFAQKHCIGCHGPERAEGKFRLSSQ